MSKPGRREHQPEDLARFTNRDDQKKLFRYYLSSPTEPPVLMFFGIGGCGKSWLLKTLRLEAQAEVPVAFLDFDTRAGGQRFVLDPAAALYAIRQQVARPTPRFDLAYAMLRHKQGAGDEPGFRGEGTLHRALEVALELAELPLLGAAFKLSQPLLSRLKDTPLEHFVTSAMGGRFLLELRKRTDQEIGSELMYYLEADLREGLTTRLDRAVSAVLLFDLGSDAQTTDQQRSREQWIREIAASFDFAFLTIAGPNRLTWEEGDPRWAESLDQQLLGGLAEDHARQFLENCGIAGAALQAAILDTAREPESGGYHCFSLGLCADIVSSERGAGREPAAETLRFAAHDWEALADRFLKSLGSASERRWIERLAFTYRFDETAARAAFSQEPGAAQDAAWETLAGYSFVSRLPDMPHWFTIRSQMRRAIEKRPSASQRKLDDHRWWRTHWASRSEDAADNAAALAWYHLQFLEPDTALREWNRLAEAARTSVPPRMQEHSRLLSWWDPVGLLEAPLSSVQSARNCNDFGLELGEASVGDRTANLRLAIRCYEAVLRVYDERESPEDWAATQNNLGLAWSRLPTVDRADNLRHAVDCYHAALRIFTEQAFPRDWALMQNNLGIVWADLSTGGWGNHWQQAIDCHEAALRVYTEQRLPRDWAMANNNLGVAWANLPIGDREANLWRAIDCYQAALRVRQEQHVPQDWAATQNNLGTAWCELPTGDRGANLLLAIECFQATLRVYTERDFPQNWAATQNNLGLAWSDLPSGDAAANLQQAVDCYQAALRVFTEKDFPQNWAMTQNHLGSAWRNLETDDPDDNLRRAIECYLAALCVYTEQKFPSEWAGTQNNLGNAWSDLPTDDGGDNLRRAIECYQAALRVYTEQDSPQDWAMTQHNLGAAWRNLPRDDGDDNLRRAIDCYQAALRVRTEQNFPEKWAATQNNLGIAWASLRTGDRSANLRRAIDCFDAALGVYTEQDFPRDHELVTENLQIARQALAAPAGDAAGAP